MDDDWASDGEEQSGLGDISALPDLPPPPSPPPAPPSEPAPEPNKPSSSASRLHSLSSRPSQPPPNAWGNPGGRMRPTGGASSAGAPFHQHHQHHHNHHNHNPPPRSRPSGPVSLYVTNMPFDTAERELSSFFARAGVEPTEVRLHRYPDGRRVRAATVVLAPDVAPALALSLHGRPFRTRTLNIRMDSDRDRAADYGPGSSTGSLPLSSPAVSMDASAVAAAGPGPSAAANAGAGAPGAPGAPVAPPPARKKLQLKPRTKPLPVLEVDARAVHGMRAGSSAPPPSASLPNLPTSPSPPSAPPSGSGRGARRPAHHRSGSMSGSSGGGGRGPGRTSDRMRMPRSGSGSGGDRMSNTFDSFLDSSPASSFGGGGGGGGNNSASRAAAGGGGGAPGVRVPQSAPPANSSSSQAGAFGNGGGKQGYTNRANGSGWRGGSNASSDSGGAWTNAREFGNKAGPGQSRDPGSKKEDEQKRPALLNAFAALEVNDAES